MRIALCRLSCALWLLGCATPPPVVVKEGDLQITYRPADGTYDIARGGVLVFSRATADALIDRGNGAHLYSFIDDCTRTQRDGELLCSRDGVVLHLRLAIVEDHVTVR